MHDSKALLAPRPRTTRCLHTSQVYELWQNPSESEFILVSEAKGYCRDFIVWAAVVVLELYYLDA